MHAGRKLKETQTGFQKNQLAKLTNTLLSSQTTRRINPCGLEASGFAPCWGREPCPRRCFPVRFGPARSDVRELYTSSRPPKTGGSLKIVYAGQRPFSSEEAPRGPHPAAEHAATRSGPAKPIGAPPLGDGLPSHQQAHP